MNRQSQGLFEAPFTSEAILYTDPYAHPEFYSNPEWESEWELAEVFPLNEEEWETVGRLKVPRRSMPQRPASVQVPRQQGSPTQPRPALSNRPLASPLKSSAQPRVLTYTRKDVIDPRISVPAQHSLVRLSKNSATSADAVGILEAVKAGQLASIYKADEGKPIQRAQRLDKRLGWGSLIPKAQGSALVLDPNNVFRGQPMIVFHPSLAPTSKATELDAVLMKGWQAYLTFRSEGTNGAICCMNLEVPEVLDRFEFDKDTVLPFHQPQIARVARCVVSREKSPQPVRSIRIEGHTDPVGTDEYNVQLGFRRARQVERHLRQSIEAQQRGLTSKIAFDVKSLGESKPTGQGADRDRRVEIFLPSQGTLQNCPCPPTSSRDFNTWLQRSLRQILKLNDLRIDGKFNPQTRSALQHFQQRAGLFPSGTVDRATQFALSKAANEQAPCKTNCPPPQQCQLFLPTNASQDWVNYIDPRTTGRIIPLINGQYSGGAAPKGDLSEAFDAMQQSVESLQEGDYVYLAAWMFDPRVSLTRSSSLKVSTWGELFQHQASQGVKIRIIMSDFDSVMAAWRNDVYNNFLPALNQHINNLSPATQDNLKYIVSRHPVTYTITLPSYTRTFFAATHHQKFMVVSRRFQTTAFCGGLDIAPWRIPADWKINGNPWHDIHVKLEGVITHSLEREFILRWNREKDASVVAAHKGWKGLETLHLLPVHPSDQTPDRNRHSLQMLRTISIPGSPVQNTTRDDIWQTYLHLIECAQAFIYIEQQYIREPRLADAIAAQAKKLPELVVIIVVPWQFDEGQGDPVTQHGNALQLEFFTRLAAALDPKKLGIYTMFRRFIHAKLLLIDDRAMTVGSANANPRGFQLDTELNILVDQPDIVTGFRHRLWAHDLGVSQAGVAGWKVSEFITRWDAVAKANQSLQSQPDKMTGETIIPYDFHGIKGQKIPIPDVLAEMSNSDVEKLSISRKYYPDYI